jgi:phage baseplate assembly protein W
MERDFLGVGWRTPLGLTPQGQVAMVRDEDSIRQSIWMILSTAPGERLMRPDFGCGIHQLVFAPNSAATAGQLGEEVRRALIQWEPRVDLLEVDAYPDETQPNRLLIEINYQVRRTNNRFNLVYPFYLDY